MIKYHEYDKLLKRLPTFKLSYEETLHKKVTQTNNNIYMAIPYGNKFMAWFTYYKNRDVCILLELTNKKDISNMKIINCCFHKDLSLGTVLYGTLINNKFFSVENIYFFKGKNTSLETFERKLFILNDLFSNYIKQISLNKEFIVFGLPLLSYDYNKLIQDSNALPYKIYSIKIINFHNSNKPHYNIIYKNINEDITAIFDVDADVQEDIYNLYYNNNNVIEYHNIAFIDSYKTSCFMNNTFRIIKENISLDALEESDDEDEFENINEDKFLLKNIRKHIKCRYNKKFKKWVPIEIVNNSVPISTKEYIKRTECKY